jgi:hypothetical protein
VNVRRGATLGIACALAISFGSAPGRAYIPSATKLADAAAEANRVARRDSPLWFEVSLRIGDSDPVAIGRLVSHPTGLARLELKSHRGFIERHLLQGDAYTASRDGRPIDHPRPFLPPLFLLQVTSGAALTAALESFGVAPDVVALGRVEDHDCYVLGGRIPRKPGQEEQRLPSLWIDMESYEVVRIDLRDGVRFRFGPSTQFDDRIRVPRWIAIEAPGQAPARLEVTRVAPANAPAAAFGIDWLAGPGEEVLESPRGDSGLMQRDRNTE